MLKVILADFQFVPFSRLAYNGYKRQLIAESRKCWVIRYGVDEADGDAGNLVTILCLYVVQAAVQSEQVHALPLVGKPLQRTLKLVWRREQFLTPIARALLSRLSDRLLALRDVIAEKRAT